MKKTKIIAGLFVMAIALGSIKAASADGGLIPQPGRYIYETDQKAVIFYEKGVENLVLSISFRGDAKEFAWIVPTPSKPAVEKSTDTLFTKLDEMTRPDEMPAYPMGGRYDLEGKMMSNDAGVSVLEEKKIEYYDIAVLEANDKDALYNWLNDHGYRFPLAGTYITDDYIQKNWIFTAIKISDDAPVVITESQLFSGRAVPLRLTFSTDTMVYPLKISALNGMEDNAPEGEATYVDGQSGKGLKLDGDRILATDAVVKDFKADQGKVRFYLKKRSSDSIGDIVKLEQPTKASNLQEGFLVRNIRQNVFTFELFRSGAERQYAEVDLGSDFKTNTWQEYEFLWEKKTGDPRQAVIKFFIDGNERTLDTRTTGSHGISAAETTDTAKVLIGGRERYIVNMKENIYEDDDEDVYPPSNVKPSYYSSRTSDLMIDSLSIDSGDQTILRSEFENNLDAALAKGEKGIFRVFTKTTGKIKSSTRPSSTGILLYIFADKRYELPGFDTQYAGWIEKKDILAIAKIDGKTPWMEPQGEKYFLTRLYKWMPNAEMNEDLYPNASDGTGESTPPTEDQKKVWFYILLGVSTVVVIGLIITAITLVRKEKNASL